MGLHTFIGQYRNLAAQAHNNGKYRRSSKCWHCRLYLRHKLNVSSTNSEQCKLCVNGSLYIDARLLWKQAIGSNCS